MIPTKIPTKTIADSELFDAHVRTLIKHINSIESVIFEIALLVFVIAGVAQLFSFQIRAVGLPNDFDGSEFKRLIPIALTGVGGIAVLTSTILIFVYFLRGKTKKLKGLELKVVGAFIKALDESPLRSHTVDKKYREQLTP